MRLLEEDIRRDLIVPYESIKLLRDVAVGTSASVGLGVWKGTRVAVKR